ncbi:arginase [Thiotrichales bacterium 19S3-7]|nr:arginase [Thiotrichales bacterium 19S3-7]MCF6802754.1 arginase [Thiotrichales bacterium 19S3-11]
MHNYKFIGASVGHCAGITGCELAPNLVKEKFNLHNQWIKTVYYQGNQRHLNALDNLVTFSKDLASVTKNTVKSGHKFITIGGDHSCAIGTWSGVAQVHTEFGLIWIDAHMDAHTPDSSDSGNLHGMPVASLLGYGEQKLAHILSETVKVKPENIILIGIRSFESSEAKLIKKLGIKVFMIDEVKKLGFQACFNQALNYFKERQLNFGISFDLDGLDPKDIQALGTPVEDGIRLNELIESFKKIPEKYLIGLEITEYNPSLDKNDKGLEVIQRVLNSIIGLTHKYADSVDCC